jgi:hypothetical protein
MIVTVRPEDYGGNTPLAGVQFQRKWESLAYREGKGKIPIQTFGDFENNQPTKKLGSLTPNLKGDYTLANVRNCLPDYVATTIIEGIHSFDKKMKGFGDKDVLLAGVETRTSSPVRILRNEELQSVMTGVYPCGEGAGYAGGIMSAAIDGIKVFEKIVAKYQPLKRRKEQGD